MAFSTCFKPYVRQYRQINLTRMVLVKFFRRYFPELHGFCARSGHALALLAYERLPGSWYGLTMEYVADAVLVTKYRRISKYFEQWKIDLHRLVAKFHDAGWHQGNCTCRP